MAPRLPKVVPWHSAEELAQVHSWLYPPPNEDGSPNIQAQECALRRVRAWEARGKLPHAIDSTVSFVQAVVKDWTMSSTDQELRLLYSMVFIRFVNGYVDAFQSSKAAKSIAYLAVEKVGMPVWFVELRHTATHDYLPSLAILRRATNQALGWINDNYWMPQLAAIKRDEEPSPEVKSAMKDDVRALIESYRSAKEVQIEANSMPNPKSDSVVLDKLFRDLIRKCGGSGDSLVEVLVPVLLESSMLIPKSKKMRASARDLSLDMAWIKYLVKHHYDNLSKNKYKATSSSSTKIPSASTSTTPSETPARLSIASLAARLVAAQGSSSTGSALRPMFDYDDILNIVEDCLQNSLANVSPLVRSVLNTVIECDSEIKEKIGPILKVIDQKLVAASGSQTPTATTASASQSGRTFDDDETENGSSRKRARLADQTPDQAEQEQPEEQPLDSQPEGEGAQKNEGAAQEKEAWTLYDADQWRSCPIGCLPGGILPDLSLPFDLDMPSLARIPL
ncbi:rRNA-processing protein las1 [Lunasporangiospora selenospora]|uniref:rRNA-processing protein las1 n=1 Tax=Lunasporangiospora selenospora TaxID=979761 RepID=A0A9P6FWJ6_9FUNG|nr:rRNA-processing protein las1 [Lunasporangiospora selenospora]